jgi:hypothetical protein
MSQLNPLDYAGPGSIIKPKPRRHLRKGAMNKAASVPVEKPEGR